MSTPQSQLPPDFDASAASRVPDFDEYAAAKRAASPAPAPRARTSASRPAEVNPQLDSFVNDVMAEASRRTGYTYRLGSGVRAPDEQAQKVAGGFSRTYNSRHLTGDARDVLAFDSQGNYITDGSHPAYGALGAVYREKAASSPISVKWGGDFQSFHDPGHFELGEASAQEPAPDFDEYAAAHKDVPDFDVYLAQKQSDDGVVKIESAVNRDGSPRPLGGTFHIGPGGFPVVTMSPQAASYGPPPALPQRQTFDPTTEEGRRARDERDALERAPGARLEVAVPLPANLEDADSGSVVRDAYRSAAVARGVPAEFFDKWVNEHAPAGYSLHDAKGKELTVGDAMKPGGYDERNHSLRVGIDPNHLSKIIDDYHSSKGATARAADWVTDPERSAGEKALDVAAPVASAAGNVLDKAGRVANALTAAEWSSLRGTGMGSSTGVEINPKGEAAVLAALEGREVPEYARNPVGEAARNSETLKAINPRLPALAGVAGDLVDPLALIPVGEVGELLQAGKLGRAVEAGGELTQRVARAAGLLDRGMVDAAPLGLEGAGFGATRAASTAADAAGESLDVFMRGHDGTNYLVNAGSGEVVNLDTGEVVDLSQPENVTQPSPLRALRDEHAQTLAGHRRAADEARAQLLGGVDEHGEPLSESDRAGLESDVRAAEHSQRFYESLISDVDAHLKDAAAPASAAPEQPLHEFLEDLTGQPAPDIRPAPPPPGGVVGRAADAVSDVVNLPKSLKSSFALHGPFRQGIPQVLAHPTFLKDAIAEQVKAFASEDAYRSSVREIMSRPDYAVMKESGLFLPSTHDVEFAGHAPRVLREERFASSAAERLPGVRASSRAYHAAMDSLRVSAWDTYTADLADNPAVTRDTYKAVADLINITTGRGTVPVLNRSATGRKIIAALNNPFWSPRAMTSRFNLLSPYRLITNAANPATRPVAWLQVRDGMRATATLATTMGLLSLVPGVQVGLNPYKPGWGKVSIGNTHYDLVDGVPATARYAAQMARAFTLRAEGKRLKLGQDSYSLTRDFLRRRLSPSGAVVADAATGKTVEGEPFTYTTAARDLLVPFVVEDVYKGWLDAGGSSVGDALGGEKEFKTGFKGAAKGLPSAVGIPSSTYPERAYPERQPLRFSRNEGP